MTTINNSENLIEKVGGIEKAREIVGGAPNGTTHIVRSTYLRLLGAVWWQAWLPSWSHATNSMVYDWKGESIELISTWGDVFKLEDLRTAIAKHDLKQCQHGYDIACLICGFGNENGVRVWRKQIESDEVTDIRNHVSPSTLVWDLAGGEDWTAEAERHG